MRPHLLLSSRCALSGRAYAHASAAALPLHLPLVRVALATTSQPQYRARARARAPALAACNREANTAPHPLHLRPPSACEQVWRMMMRALSMLKEARKTNRTERIWQHLPIPKNSKNLQPHLQRNRTLRTWNCQLNIRNRFWLLRVLRVPSFRHEKLCV